MGHGDGVRKYDRSPASEDKIQDMGVKLRLETGMRIFNSSRKTDKSHKIYNIHKNGCSSRAKNLSGAANQPVE